MFPVGPRRPPFPSGRPFPPRNIASGPRANNRGSNNVSGNYLAMFQDADGKLDLTKVHSTVKQVNDIYRQVSPLFSWFRNRG